MLGEVCDKGLLGPELIQETTKNIRMIREIMKQAKDHQKSYMDHQIKPL